MGDRYLPLDVFFGTFQLGEHAVAVRELVTGDDAGMVEVECAPPAWWVERMRHLLALDSRFELYRDGLPEGVDCKTAMADVEDVMASRQQCLAEMSAAGGLAVGCTMMTPSAVPFNEFSVVWSPADAARFVEGAFGDMDRGALVREYVVSPVGGASVFYSEHYMFDGSTVSVDHPSEFVAYHLYHSVVAANMAVRRRLDLSIHSAVVRDCESLYWHDDVDGVMATEYPELRTRSQLAPYNYGAVNRPTR
jgi:hypothetical protein